MTSEPGKCKFCNHLWMLHNVEQSYNCGLLFTCNYIYEDDKRRCGCELGASA